MSVNSAFTDDGSNILSEVMQEFHSDIFSNLGIGILFLDKKDNVLYFNEFLQVLTGTVQEEVTGKDLKQLCSTVLRDYSALFRHLLSIKQQGKFNEQSFVRLITSDGNLNYFSLECLPYTGEKNSYNGMLCLLKDETIKVVCSNRFSFGNDEADALHLPFVTFLWKKDDVWSVEHVSDNVVQFGYTPEDFISGNLTYADIIHPDHLESVKNAVDMCADNYFSKEYMLLTAKEGPRWVLERSYAVRDEDRNITHFHGAIIDIDERKKDHEVLRESEIKMRAIFDNASEFICLSDTDGRILEANRVMLETFVYRGSEVSGMLITQLLPDDVHSKIPAFIRKIIEKGLITLEIDVLDKNGDLLPLEVNAQLIEYNDTKHLLFIGRDISERRMLEKAIWEHSEQLEHSNEIKDMFTDVAGHDLINSVSLIEGFVKHLSDMEVDKEKKQILSYILNSTGKLRKTIDSASVFARLNSSTDLEVRTLDICRICNNALERLDNLVRDGNIKVVLNSPEYCPAYVNPIIEEVFFNLISNAIKYSPQGAEVIMNITDDGGKWKVSVSDFGFGIPDEEKTEIFDRFRRSGFSKVKGKGLGLSIAKLALKCHGEELNVADNKAGKGTTFWFNVKMSDKFENLE